MMVIVLKNARVIDGRLREAGEVVSVPDTFRPKHIAKILQNNGDDMAEKVRRKQKQEQIEDTTNFATVVTQDRLKDAPQGVNIAGAIGLLLVGDRIESMEIDGNWWRVSRVVRNESDIPLPPNGWIRDVNLQVTNG